MTITVLATKNIASEFETESSASRGAGNSGGSRSWRGHSVSRHIIAVGSDGNVYDLTPKNQNDFLIPGEYPAYLTSKGMVVGGLEVCLSAFGHETPCTKPKQTKHRIIMEFNIVAVEPKQHQDNALP